MSMRSRRFGVLALVAAKRAPGGVSLGIFLKIIPYFQPIFSGFLETTSLSIF